MERKHDRPATNRMVVTAVALLLTCSSAHAADEENAESSAGSALAPGTAAPGAEASSSVYAVTFGVKTSSGRLSAVQFEAIPGEGRTWKTTAGKVACRNVSGAAMQACNDKGGATLSCALVDLTGVETPSDLVTCEIVSSTKISASELTVEVVDASDPQASPVKVEVVVTKVQAN